MTWTNPIGVEFVKIREIPHKEYHCTYCGGPGDQCVIMGISATDSEKPSMVFGYWVCGVCRIANWDNNKPVRTLRDHLTGILEGFDE